MYNVEAFISSIATTSMLGRVVGFSLICGVLLLSTGCFEEEAKEVNKGLTNLGASMENVGDSIKNADPLNIKAYVDVKIENERLKSQKKSLAIRVTHVLDGAKVNITGRVQEKNFWENVEFPRTSSPELTLLEKEKPTQPEPPTLETVPEAVSAPGAARIVEAIPQMGVNAGKVMKNTEKKHNDERQAIIARNSANLETYNQDVKEFPGKQNEWQQKWFDAIYKLSQVNVMGFVNSIGELPIILDIEPKTENWSVRIELIMEPWTSPADTLFIGEYSSDNKTYQNLVAKMKNNEKKELPTITQHINTRIVTSIAASGSQSATSN